MILEVVMMEVSAKRLSPFIILLSGYYIKVITNSWNSKNKYKKETITTFRIPSTPSYSKFP